MADVVKTTVELPLDLLRAVKLQALHQNRRMKDVIADALRRGLDTPEGDSGHHVTLPLVYNTHAATPGAELTPDRIADIQLVADVAAARP